MDHDPDKHDDHAISLALAAHHLLEGRSDGGVTTDCYRCQPGHPLTGPGARPCSPPGAPERHMTKTGLWASGPPDLPFVDIEEYLTPSPVSTGRVAFDGDEEP